MAQLAVLRVGLDAEIDIAVAGHVGMAAGHQIPHQLQDLLDVLGGAGLDGGPLDVQTVGVLQVLVGIVLGHLRHGNALFLGAVDQLVVNVGDVGDKNHLVAPVFQVAAQRIEHHQRAGVAHVDIVVDRGATDVDAVFPGGLGDKLLLAAGHGIEDLHRMASFLPAAWRRMDI